MTRRVTSGPARLRTRARTRTGVPCVWRVAHGEITAHSASSDRTGACTVRGETRRSGPPPSQRLQRAGREHHDPCWRARRTNHTPAGVCAGKREWGFKVCAGHKIRCARGAFMRNGRSARGSSPPTISFTLLWYRNQLKFGLPAQQRDAGVNQHAVQAK